MRPHTIGFSLHRFLESSGIDNKVIAPSLIPELASDRVKTDRLDSSKLARYFSKVTMKQEWPGFVCDWERKIGRKHIGVPLEVSRKSPEPEKTASLTIKSKNYLIGYLDSTEMSRVFWVPSYVDIRKIEVIQTSIKIAHPTLDELIITAKDKTLSWKPLRRPDGQRLGATRNLNLKTSSILFLIGGIVFAKST